MIPGGSSGVLTNLAYTAIAEEACLGGAVLSDPNGQALDIDLGGCVELDYSEPCDDVDNDGICDDVDDCVGEYDECGVCNGDGATECWDGSAECDPSNCPDEPSGNVALSFGSVGDTSLEILMDTPYDVAGFQFNVEGTSLSSASGGLAADAGFTVSVGGNTVIGFSLQGYVFAG